MARARLGAKANQWGSAAAPRSAARRTSALALPATRHAGVSHLQRSGVRGREPPPAATHAHRAPPPALPLPWGKAQICFQEPTHPLPRAAPRPAPRGACVCFPGSKRGPTRSVVPPMGLFYTQLTHLKKTTPPPPPPFWPFFFYSEKIIYTHIINTV